jgi:hypothetical protein
VSEFQSICTQCNTLVQVDSIFCFKCGVNLQLPKIINSLHDISYKFDIESDYLTQYQSLTDKIAEFDGLEIQMQQQKDYYNHIYIEYNKQKLENERLKKLAETETKEVEELKKRSWVSIKARIKGELDQLLAIEEAEYLEVMHRIEASEKTLIDLETKLKNSESQFDELKAVFNSKNEIELERKELVFRAAEGIIDEKEDQIEIELSNQSVKIDPLLVQKSKLQASLSHLAHALDLLSVAKGEFISSENDAKNLMGNELMSDSIKSSKIAEIRDLISLTSQSLNHACVLLNDLGAHTEINQIEGGHFWENFIKEFIKELEQGSRTHRTIGQIEKAITQTNQIISWISSQISKVNLDIEEIFAEIRILQNELMKQRIRIFKKQLKNSD